MFIRKPSDQSLEEAYNRFKNNADKLKIASNGLINMYITGSLPDTAVKLFLSLNKLLKTNPINETEARWIANATRAPIVYAEKYKGAAYFYDFISMHLSVMNDHKMLFPLLEGQYDTYSIAEFNNATFVPYGIYCCIIKPYDDKNLNKLFRFNKTNTYTHIDINDAKKFGLTVKLLQESPNCLLYKKDTLIQGNKLFGEYTKLVFDLKQKKIDRAKVLSVCLWGKLCEINDKAKLYCEVGQTNNLEIFDSKNIHLIIPTGKPNQNHNCKLMIKTAKKSNYFATNFARLKPFLLAGVRRKLRTTCFPHIESIKWIHTDGFLSSKKLDIKTGTKFGNLKYEGFIEKDYKVKNAIHKDKKTDLQL